ncbi:MAG: tetratricopeptide repeat protein [Caulobacteraceae bacterium]
MDDDEAKNDADEGSRPALRAGRKALKQGDAAAALPLLEAAAAEAPGDTAVLALLARALSKLGRPAQAKAVWRRILDADPTHERARAKLAEAEAGGEAPAEGAEAGAPDQARRAARAARKKARAATALPELETAAAENPNDLAALAALADALAKAGRTADLAAVNQRILEQDPANAKALTQLGVAAWKRGDRTEALRHLKAAAITDEADPRALLRLGQRLISQWQIDEAEKVFERVIGLEPNNVEGLLGLARCSGYGGDRERALTLLRRAAVLQPQNPQIALYIRRQETEPPQLDWKQELREATVALRDEGRPTGERIWSAQRVLSYGVTDVILETLPSLEANSAKARRFVQIARQLDRSGLSQPSWASGESTDPEAEQLNALTGIAERLKPGADVLLLVFSGAMNRAFLSLDILHRILRKTGVSIAYLRDLERTLYFGGIVGLGADFNSTTEALRDLQRRSGARRLMMFGNCIGCGGALRYGLALGAEAVLGVSPRIGAAAGEALAPSTKSKLQALMGGAEGFAGDLIDLYIGAGAAAPDVTLVAGEGSEPEATFAREMSARVPGVVYAAIPDVYLECFGDILARGLFTPMMSSFVADGKVAPEVIEALRHPAPPPPEASATRLESAAGAAP